MEILKRQFTHPGSAEALRRARDAIQGNLTGSMAKDMPYTPYTDGTLQRLAGPGAKD